MMSKILDEHRPPAAPPPAEEGTPLAEHPLGALSREDLDLIMALVIESGSLKGLAKRYGVSYPTIRGRVDRVIERLEAILEGRPRSPLNELLGDLVERGRLSASIAERILKLSRESVGPRAEGSV